MNAKVLEVASVLSPSSSPLTFILLVLGMAIVPFLLLSVTCFVKLHVVLNILRNALGAGQVPSGVVITLISLLLTAYIMEPVFEEAYQSISAKVDANAVPIKKGKQQVVEEVGALSEFVSVGTGPFRHFLMRHARFEEREFFIEARNVAEKQKQQPLPDVHAGECAPSASEYCELTGESMLTLMPAFLVTELREAFAIGFTIFLPFVAIDLIVANILVGLGMFMVSPVTVSLPFKLLLFVLCDGWFLITKNLIFGYF